MRVDDSTVVIVGVNISNPFDTMMLRMDMLCPGVAFDVHCDGNTGLSGWRTFSE